MQQNLIELIDLYTQHLLVIKGLAEKTIEAYNQDLSTLASFLQRKNIKIENTGIEASPFDGDC